MKIWKAISLAVGLAITAVEARAADVGKPAPPFTIRTFDGRTFSSADLRGRVVLINYWATWCAPCHNEMKAFDHYVRTHPGSDLMIFSITEDASVPVYMLKDLAKTMAYPLGRSLDGRGYGILRALPTSYVIDRSGVLRHADYGAFTEDSLDRLVGPLLAQSNPASTGSAEVQK